MAMPMQFFSNFDNDDDDDAGCSGEQVYGFGAGKRGQLGISKKIQTVNLPILSSELEAAEIVGIAAGGDHSAALSSEHQIFFLSILIPPVNLYLGIILRRFVYKPCYETPFYWYYFGRGRCAILC